MNDNVNYLAPVSELSVDDRSTFIWKCYAHVVGAILVFGAIEVYLYESGISAAIAGPMLKNWWMVLGASCSPPGSIHSGAIHGACRIYCCGSIDIRALALHGYDDGARND
jgi:hypothetical protein